MSRWKLWGAFVVTGFFIHASAMTPQAVAEDKPAAKAGISEELVDPAAEFAEKAEALFADKKYAESEKLWRLICEKHPHSPSYGVAQFNVGYTLQAQQQYETAIAEYQKLLVSKVNDKDPGANLMQAYRNYRNSAAKQISECYELRGMHREALQWAIQARDKYPYGSWCGTCIMQERAASAENITRLQKLAGAAKP